MKIEPACPTRTEIEWSHRIARSEYDSILKCPSAEPYAVGQTGGK